MTRRVAVVLFGPPGVGKSQVRERLEKLYQGEVRSVNLDEGWVQGEFRYLGGPDRYKDLRCSEKVLLIEIAGGEPVDRKTLGATRNPAEWGKVLFEEKREISLFHLAASLETSLNGQLDRAKRRSEELDISTAKLTYFLQGRDREGFADRLQCIEMTLDVATYGSNFDAIANEIKRIVDNGPHSSVPAD